MPAVNTCTIVTVTVFAKNRVTFIFVGTRDAYGDYAQNTHTTPIVLPMDYAPINFRAYNLVGNPTI